MTVVRPAIFFGDGIPVYIWDSERFIGIAIPGTMFQYETDPGEHLFLGNAENWTYAKGALEPGRHYFLKVNIFPGVMVARAALGTLPEGDPDLVKNLTVQSVVPEKQREYEVENRARVVDAIALFKSGGVSAFATMKPVGAR